jgi:hypothetical protein
VRVEVKNIGEQATKKGPHRSKVSAGLANGRMALKIDKASFASILAAVMH